MLIIIIIIIIINGLDFVFTRNVIAEAESYSDIVCVCVFLYRRTFLVLGLT